MHISSLWVDTVDTRVRYPELKNEIRADVVVVGAGVTGIMTAYHLAKGGKSVVLLEKSTVASGETAYTTAMLTYVTDTPLTKLHGTFGDSKARSIWQSGRESIDVLEILTHTEQIDCDFVRCPAYIHAPDKDGADFLEKEAKLATEFDFPVQLTDFGPLPGMKRFLIVPDQAKFHPRKFLLTLLDRAVSKGVRVFEQSAVTEFSGVHKTTVHTALGKVHADQVVIATHTPIDNPIEFPTRLASTQTYVVEAIIPTSTLPEGLYWDTHDPYYYFRVDPLTPKTQRVTLGGEDHPTGETEDTTKHFTALKAHFSSLFPVVLPDWTREWSGQILTTIDGAPFIGASSLNSHHYVATGYGGNGMTFGTIASMIIADAILQKNNAWADLYSPARAKGIGHFLQLGAHFVKELFSGHAAPNGADTDILAVDSGVVIVENGKKIAVYKDANGKLSACSATCTHLGCTVAWNQAATTWDCPCHGSRFTATGEVMSGPATTPLRPINIDELKS